MIHSWFYATVVSILFLFQHASALFRLPADGYITPEDHRWGTLFYYSRRYEPLCGTLGTTDYSEPWSGGGGVCDPAIEAYASSLKTLGYYDTAGLELENAIVGNSTRELCLCFSLTQDSFVGGDDLSGDICLWFNEVGEGEYDAESGDMVGSYRPGAIKALPHCDDVDVIALESSWNATAIPDEGALSTVLAGGTITTRSFRVSPTSTPAIGESPVDAPEESPVDPPVQQKQTLSLAAKIAIGVTVPIGIGGLAALGAFLWLRRRRNHGPEAQRLPDELPQPVVQQIAPQPLVPQPPAPAPHPPAPQPLAPVGRGNREAGPV